MLQHNHLENKSLNELVVIIGQTQNKHAFVQLFNLTSSKLKAYAIRCGAKPSEAEELVQECYLAVWRKAHTFNPKTASASTWLFTIVRNKHIDLLRKDRPDLVTSDDLWPEQTTEDLEIDVESDLNGKVVRTLIETLPQEQRQIIYKVYFEGKSHSEISEELNLPLGTIKSRLRLAMKKLDTMAKENISWLIIILMTNF
ncbi:sigma-70 family RNA polymerase sigma factor [Litoribacillus peritrichatus]|uniref:Sigma-70 family RNA polymerase sigma factor n=1 Tax=Litoribacillus peritrichatus TaxID=718191 RepID=A0ABP7N2U8_9GAMM